MNAKRGEESPAQVSEAKALLTPLPSQRSRPATSHCSLQQDFSPAASCRKPPAPLENQSYCVSPSAVPQPLRPPAAIPTISRPPSGGCLLFLLTTSDDSRWIVLSPCLLLSCLLTWSSRLRRPEARTHSLGPSADSEAPWGAGPTSWFPPQAGG